MPKEKYAPVRERVAPSVWRRHTKDGQARYEIQLRVGRRMHRETVDSFNQALDRVAELRLAKRDGHLGDKGVDVLTFAAASERWLDAEVTRLRPSTQRSYEGALRTHLWKGWGDLALAEITVAMVADFVVDQERAGAKAWSIRSRLVVASRVFQYATRRLDYEGVNPIKQLDRNERPRSEPSPKRVLTTAELQALLEKLPTPCKQAVMFSAMTGCRLGECLGLTWGRVDLQQRTADISVQMGRAGKLVGGAREPATISPLKTRRSRRTVLLPGGLVMHLAALALESTHSADTDYVFNRDGEPLEHRDVSEQVRRAVKAAGIIETDETGRCTFHSMRRTFASRMVAEGVDLQEVSDALGHSNIAVTALYVQSFEKRERADQRRQRLESAFADLGEAA